MTEPEKRELIRKLCELKLGTIHKDYEPPLPAPNFKVLQGRELPLILTRKEFHDLLGTGTEGP